MTSIAPQQDLIQAHGLTVRFGDTLVLDNLDFTIVRGEFIGLIGPNGAGKTTLLKTLLGLTEPTDGTLTIAPDTTIRYVPQHYTLPAHMPISVREVISMGTRRPLQASRIAEALTQVGLPSTVAPENFHALSGGQKQRVLIARVLIATPDVIFFDEPLSGVDVTSKHVIYNLLRQYNDQGMTILFVSHDVDHVIDACTRVLCLDRALHHGCHPTDFAHGERDAHTEHKQQIHHHH